MKPSSCSMELSEACQVPAALRTETEACMDLTPANLTAGCAGDLLNGGARSVDERLHRVGGRRARQAGARQRGGQAVPGGNAALRLPVAACGAQLGCQAVDALLRLAQQLAHDLAPCKKTALSGKESGPLFCAFQGILQIGLATGAPHSGHWRAIT